MLYAIYCVDKPNSKDVRMANRPAHIEYLKAKEGQILMGGAMLTEDGEGMLGSLLVIDAEDEAAARAFVDGDPFAKAGLFQSVTVNRWRKAFFNPGVGA
jgi:uncharacterized protein YciI